MQEAAAVEMRQISFTYGREPILEDVSLSVGRGDFVGLVGPNGSGKTTLLRILLGLERPQRGAVTLFGHDLATFRQWSRVGYVPQKAASFNTGLPATVREVVLTGRIPQRGLFRPLGRPDRVLAYRALELVGIEALADRPIGELSGGQQQRAFIARALASRPELLILDEPTVGVDTAAQEQFYALLRRLRHEMSLTIILVTHDVGVVTTEVSHIACLNRRLCFHGPPADLDGHVWTELYGDGVGIVHHRH